MATEKIQQIGALLREVSTQAIKRSNLVSAILGINSTDLEALEVLMRLGKATAGVLAAETGITGGAVTKMVDRLEKAGFILRETDPNDRRKVYITLHVNNLESKVLPLYQSLVGAVNALLDEYSPQEQQLIISFLSRSIQINREDMEKLAAEH
ncbi:MarR family winged helix-turn-helix transcriptional regulator [Sphingobacterium thalpophilum]|uniref:MarR family transcriptional regulator n=1 Tax=Sphingobacterium thalpophilum TaxID=259 RepID=A0A4U9VZT8_9SPHI|nr:MarR family transcriptional regulator [Sphingobacterium thalpophilum]VTR49641.1 Predicted transcriptional regulator [Sphingobacterium thalpophilum]